MTKSATTKPRLMEHRRTQTELRGTSLPVKLLLHCCRAALLRDGQYPKRGHTAKGHHGTQWMAVIRKEMVGRAYHGEHPVGVLTWLRATRRIRRYVAGGLSSYALVSCCVSQALPDV